MKLSGAEILIECLLEQGVDTVFGFPGGAVLNIYDALYKYSDKINHILTAHEQGATHAADGYARSSGKTGVVIATSGPGATNTVTGIATAYMDSTPMVVITGNVARSLLGLDSFQEVDIVGITMPITKHNYIVKDVNMLADTVREAFKIANQGRKGPVLIDIPKDITAAECEYEKDLLKNQKLEFKIKEDEINQVVKAISKSKRPLIYTGGGVISSEASDELKVFAELVNAPVSCSLMGQGGFPKTDKRYIGMLGMHGTKTSSAVIGECDLLIGIGTRFSDRVICNVKTFAPDAEIIHIDIDPSEMNKNVDVSLTLTGDIRDVLKKLNNALKESAAIKPNSKWMEYVYKLKREFPLMQKGRNSDELTPQFILETLDKMTDGECIISTEVGQHQMWAAQFYNFKKPRTFITSGGLGTMGFGLGAAIGAQTANPEKRVVNIAGDGSFHMNLHELSTISRYNIPVIEVIFNNGVLGMVRQWQRLFYGKRFSHTTLENTTDFEMLANAFGIEALTVKAKEDVEPAFTKALKSKKPVVINCIIDKDINVLPMVPAGASIGEPILEIEIND